MHNKYKEALHLASIALQMTPAENKTWPLLPHVFGSPEYLQVSHISWQVVPFIDDAYVFNCIRFIWKGSASFSF